SDQAAAGAAASALPSRGHFEFPPRRGRASQQLRVGEQGLADGPHSDRAGNEADGRARVANSSGRTGDADADAVGRERRQMTRSTRSRWRDLLGCANARRAVKARPAGCLLLLCLALAARLSAQQQPGLPGSMATPGIPSTATPPQLVNVSFQQ